MTSGPGNDDPDRRGELSPDRRRLLERLLADRAAAAAVVACGEERFWVLEQLEPGNPAHHIAGRTRLEGALDVARFAAAVERLVARHESLRTIYLAGPGGPIAEVQPARALPLPTFELDAAAADAALAQQRQQHVDDLTTPPFDLQHGPLLRHRLLRLRPTVHEYLWCVHHIAVDGASMVVLARELATLYAESVGGAASSLPAPPSFRAFARQQRQWLATPAAKAMLAEWCERLRDLTPLELPADGPGDGATARRGDRVGFDLGAAEPLLTAARQLQLTPFMLFAAGLGLLLHRLADCDAVAIGFPSLGRDAAQHHAVGLFVNSVVLRIDCTAPTFRALAHAVRDDCLWAYDRQQVPFERLVESLAPERHPTRHPLFQVLLNVVDFDLPTATLGGLTQRYEPLPAGTLLDLTLYVRRKAGAIRLEFEFDAARHRPTTMRRWLECLVELLRAVLASPDRPLDQLAIVPPPQRDELCRLGRGPALPPHAATVHERILVQCAATPGRPAIVVGAASLDYRKLAERVLGLAAGLRAVGIGPGQRVAVCVARDLDLVPTLLALSAIGAAFVPIDADQPPVRLAAILADAAVDALLLDRAELLPTAPPPRLLRADLPQRPPLTGVVDDGDADAYVLYTSGSRGAPKGVRVPQRALAAFLTAAAAALDFDAADGIAAITTLSFDIALLELLLPLTVGGAVHLAPSGLAGEPQQLARLLADPRITVLQATPTTWRLLWRNGFAGRPGLRAWVGGESLPADLAEFLRRRAAPAVNLYGPTETTIWSLGWAIVAGDVRIGRPLPGQFARVLDRRGAPLPLGVPGELAVGGSGVARGYLGDAERTAARFVDDPCGEGRIYRTGDRVRLTGDGVFEFLGRQDDQWKVHGQRVEAGEIEAALRSHPEVVDAAVDLRGPPDDRQLCAWLIACPNRSSGAGQRLQHWRAVWNATYEQAAQVDPAVDPTFDLTGWRQSLDDRPLPAAAMRAWRDAIIDGLLARAPERVLEIGCGTGLLLWPMARHCRHYVGVDSSPGVIDRLTAQLRAAQLPHVNVHCAGADGLDAVVPALQRFDLVVLNSVVQYFPDLEYLLTVLDAVAARLRPGGAIFVGDVRLQALQPALHASVVLTQADPAAPLDVLQQRLERRCRSDGELLLAPEWFAALVAHHPHLRAFRAELHAAEPDFELTRFRGNVWLFAARADAPVRRATAATLDAVERLLDAGGPVCIDGLEDPRSAPWLLAADRIRRGGAGCAASLRADLVAASTSRPGPTLAALRQLAVARGLAMSLQPGARPGTMTVWFGPAGTRPPTAGPSALPSAVDAPVAYSRRAFAAASAALASSPLQALAVAELLASLRTHLRDRLPAAAVPQSFALVDSLPRSPNGKLLRRALNQVESPVAATFVQPLPGAEAVVAATFARVLGLDRVSADDDFFALGGHSLLATQVVASLASELGVELPLRTLFAAPTVRELSRACATAAAFADRVVQPLPPDAPLELLPAHERLWFLHRLEPSSSAYHLAGVVTFAAPIAAELLVRALARVVERHELLRLAVEDDQRGAHLRAAAPRLSVDAEEATFLAAMAERCRAPFDLARDAPLRAYVATGTTTRLLIVLHHAAADGWSLAVLARDLAAAVVGLAEGAPPAWPQLPFAPTAWAAHQRQALAAARRNGLGGPWRQRLADAPKVFELPGDWPRPLVQDLAGARRTVAVSAATWAALRDAAAVTSSTPFQQFLAAATAWCARLTGSFDFVLGTVAAGRDHPGLRDQIGCFVQLLPLRMQVDSAQSFAVLRHDVAATLVEAQQHAALPFATLVQELQLPRDLARPPLVQVTVEWFEPPAAPPPLLGADVTVIELPGDHSKYDLTLRLVGNGVQAPVLQCEFATALFAPATIDRWLRSLLVLLDAALAAPATPVAHLPMLADGDRRELLELGLGPVLAVSPATVPELLFERARAQPAALAVTWPSGGTATFAMLAARSRALAAALLANGLARGDVVGIAVPRGADLLPAVLGTMAAGGVWLPLDAADPLLRRVDLMQRAQVRFVVGDERGAAELGITPVPVPAAPATADVALAVSLPQLRADDAAYVLFTSGSTGAPKGVVVEHGALVHYLAAASHYFDGASGGALLATAVTFDLSITCLFGALLRGEPVHLAPPGDGIEPWRYRPPAAAVALAKMTPAHLRALAAAGVPLPAAHTLVIGGEALAGDDVLAATQLGRRVVNEYGPTETTVGCTAFVVAAAARGPLPIGRPLANVRVYVVDAAMALLPRGAIGELCVAGPTVARGYLGDPAAMAARFQPDPFVEPGAPAARLYRTGDRARWRNDGQLEFHGRSDQQVKVLGVRIEPAEVAAALRALPGVHDAAVAAVPAPAGGNQLGAWVVLAEGTAAAVVAAALRERLPAAMQPRFVVALASLPLHRHGKLDVAALPMPTRAAAGARDAAGPVAATVAALGAELLHTEVGVDEDFFALGGDSILALQLVARAQAEGIGLTVRDVFEQRTARALAQVAKVAAPTVAVAMTPFVMAELLPIQRDWLRRNGALAARPEFGHDVQAVVAELAPTVTKAQLERALVELARVHPLLVAQLQLEPPRLVRGEGPVPLREAAVDDDAPATLRPLFAANQLHHRPTAGAMLAVLLCRTPRRCLLHLSVHHLVIDAVSWRPLLDDLAAALRGSTLAATTPFAEFVARLRQRTAAGEFGNGDDGAVPPPWPPSTGDGVPTVVDRVLVRPAAWSHQLLERHASAFEVVIAAVARALVQVAGTPVPFDVERHGREDPELDLSRTIGWFTTIHPVWLGLGPTATPGGFLRAIKRELRAVRDGGLGTGVRAIAAGRAIATAAVLVNYLGVLDLPAAALVRVTELDPGPLRSSRIVGSHPLELDLWFRDDRLHLRARSDGRIAAGVVPSIVDAVPSALACILDDRAARAYDHSDAPLLQVDDDVLAALVADTVPEDLWPLTPTQQGMLVHALQEPASAAYTEQLVHEFEGAFDHAALSTALQLLQRRHALLRAAMVWRDVPEPIWRVHRTVALPLRERDATAMLPVAAAALLRRFAAADRRFGFDFATAPLWRCTHVRLPERRHALVFTYHHTLLDGWSMPLLLAELVRVYAAALVGDDADLPAALPYRDYVAWLRAKDHAAAAAWWRQRLADVTAPTPLGIDRAPPVGQAAAPHAECERLLTRNLTAALASLQRQLGVTGSTVAQVALALVLAANSDQDDLVFGLTVSGRPAELPGAASRIGLFINTVPVRLHLFADESLGVLLQRAMRDHAAMLPWQWTPLALSQAQAGCDPGRPLFAALLVFENYPLDAALATAPPGLRTLATWTNERTSYPLTVVVVPGERWLVRLLFAPDRIAAAAAASWLGQFECALEQLVRDPDAPVGAVDVVPAEQRAAADGITSSAAPGPAGATRSWCPPAIVAAGQLRNAAAVARLANAVAASLRDRGIARGSVVGLCASRSPQQIAALFGIWRAGAVIAPLDATWPKDYVLARLHQAGCAVVLVDAVASAVVGDAVPILTLADACAHAATACDAAPLAPAELAAVVFTSGTTGTAKAVELEHGALAHYGAAAAAYLRLGSSDRVLQFASLAFDAAFEEILMTAAAGATLVLREDDLDPAAIVRQCERDAVSVLDLPTAYFQALVVHLDGRDQALPGGVRLCVLGGEAARAAPVATFLRRHPQVRLVNTYGPTEATIVATWCDLAAADAAAGEPLPIGVPVPGITATVRTAAGRLVPPGARGELWLSGPAIARGYRADPTATAARFVAAAAPNWLRSYRTGDLVRLREDGRLEYCGRLDRQCKIRGQRVELAAVEQALAAHADVAAVAVLMTAAGEGEQLVAFVVLRAGRTVDASLLRAHVRARLPAAAVPAQVHLVAELPRTTQGKVDGVALLQRARTAAAIPAAAVPVDAAPAVLQSVQSAFAAVLGTAVGPEDDFFAMGGDSLAAVRLVDAIRHRTGIDVALAMVFAAPAPAALTAALQQRLPADPPRSSVRAEDLPAQDDVTLPADWPLATARSRNGNDRPRVLLTGASGFLGGAVLTALLQRTEAEILLLQRRPLPVPTGGRCRAITGCIDQPLLGLTAAAFAELAARVDAVYHVAANTNVWLSYGSLRRDNVLGTRHVLEFCARGGAHLHHVSTVGVFDDPALGAIAIDEDFDLMPLQPAGGYARSKWAAERLVEAAIARGLRATIYRPGRLAAGSDGVLPTRDLGLGLFALCLELGCVPQLDLAIDLTPVDWAAHALVALATAPATTGNRWHLLQDEPEAVSSLAQRLDALGIPLRPLPAAVWCERVDEHLTRAPRHPQAPLRLLLTNLPASFASGPRVRCAVTRRALQGHSLPPDRIQAAALLAAVQRLQPG